MKHILFKILMFFQLMVSTFISINLQAKEQQGSVVLAAVETWVRHITADARPDAVIEKLEFYQVEGKTVAYIAHLSGGGFCLCGADELVLPVYFYCPEGKYDPQNPDYQYILKEIETRSVVLQKLIAENDPQVQTYQIFLFERSKFWNDLKNGIIPSKKINETEEFQTEPDMMVIDFTPHWHQDRPYNDQCPELTSGINEHTVVGFVATAMSQIMYYWKWPNKGQGNKTVTYNYNWRDNWDREVLGIFLKIPDNELWENRLKLTRSLRGTWVLQMNGYWDQTVLDSARRISDNSNYQTVLNTLYNRLTKASTNYSVNFYATNYNWNLIQDQHYYWDSYHDNEVAKLCFHAGVAILTNYGILGSGAQDENIDNALKDYFGYDPDACYSGRDVNKITEEIQWLRPVAFGGFRSSTENNYLTGKIGHEWVIYGYNKATDPNRQFKMNLGWGGYQDGWYTCDSIFPIDQDQVIRIAPENVKFVGGYGFDGSPDNPYNDLDKALANAPDHTTLIFKAGGKYNFSANTLVINRPLTLRGYNVTISK